MTSNPRTWLIGGVVASVLLMLVGWLTVISPRMQAVAQTRTEAVDLEDQSQMVMAQVRQLQQQAQDLPEQVAALERIQKRIPASVDVPALLRDIQRTASMDNVKIETLTPGQLTEFTTTDSASSGSATSSSGDPVATPDSTAPAPQSTPSEMGQGSLPEGAGLSYVPITITATGSFENLRAFTDSLEQLQRAYLVTGVKLARSGTDTSTSAPTSAGSSNDLSMSLDTRVFVANDRLRNLPAQAREQVGGQ